MKTGILTSGFYNVWDEGKCDEGSQVLKKKKTTGLV